MNIPQDSQQIHDMVMATTQLAATLAGIAVAIAVVGRTTTAEDAAPRSRLYVVSASVLADTVIQSPF